MTVPVSIIVVHYNGVAVLRECLRSVFAQPYRPVEVVVVDNGSHDGSPEVVQREFPDVRLLRLAGNQGFASGCNRGVEAATSDHIILLNNDTTVDEHWIPGLLHMISAEDRAVVTSKVLTDGVPPRFYTMNGTINYLGYNIMRHFSDLSEVFFAGGASLMFRRSVVGLPFPDEYFLYHEDVFLSWRMRLQGRRVGMAQTSVVHHKGSVSTRRQRGTFVTFYQERNRLLNCLLLYQVRTLVILIPYFLADGVAKLALSLCTRRKSPAGILKSYGWIMLHVQWVLARRRALQKERTVSDKEILVYMSPLVATGNSWVARLCNGASRIYAGVTGLAG